MIRRFLSSSKRISSFILEPEEATFFWYQKWNGEYREETIKRSNFGHPFMCLFYMRIKQDASNPSKGLEAAEKFKAWTRKETNEKCIFFILDSVSEEEAPKEEEEFQDILIRIPFIHLDE